MGSVDLGRPYDFERPFFEQFHELLLDVPQMSLLQINNEKCDYTHGLEYSKNCYLSFNGYNAQDCIYSVVIFNCRDCMDCVMIFDSELCYECAQIKNGYNLQFCVFTENCSDSAFLDDCVSCHHCFGCAGLRHKSYCIFNKQYSPEEYKAKMEEEFYLGSYRNLESVKKNVGEFVSKQPQHFSMSKNTENCTGYALKNSKNCHDCFFADNCQDMRYSIGINCRDCIDCGLPKAELCYECSGGEDSYNCKFSMIIIGKASNLEYCHTIFDCHDCFGCTGLRHKQYCILNKQYTKEEYEKLIVQVKKKMRESKEYGEFFPMGLSFYPYQDTVAQNLFPIDSEEEARRLGVHWEPASEEKNNSVNTENSKPDFKLADDVRDYNDPAKKDELLKQVLNCEVSGKPYRIEKPELRFYLKNKIAIPRKCFNERHKLKLGYAWQTHLFDRKCDKCGVDIRTVYGDDEVRPVYCDKCYQKEIY